MLILGTKILRLPKLVRERGVNMFEKMFEKALKIEKKVDNGL